MQSVRSLARRSAQEALKRAAAGLDAVVPPEAGGVVLIYHRVGGGSGLEVDLDAGCFDDQMAELADSGRACTLDAALARLSAPRGTEPDPVVVTFDDGTADFADVAAPIMQRHNIPSLLYVATEFIEDGRSFPDDGVPASWAALRDLTRTGLVEIGSHTHRHALLDRLADDAIADELDRSIELIGDRLGISARHFAYPKALLGSAAAQQAVRDRFVSAAVAGTRPNPYCGTDPYRVARSPVQRADGDRWFQRKLRGGMHLEDDVRQLANRVRYRGASR